MTLNKDMLPNPEGLLSFSAHRASLSMNLHCTKKLNENNIDINLNQWGIIYRLFKFGDFPEKAVPEKMFIPNKDIKKLIDNLEKKNLIERKQSKEETILSLTKESQDLIIKVIPLLFECAALFIQNIPPEHMIITVNTLNKIFHNINPKEELYVLHTPPHNIEMEN